MFGPEQRRLRTGLALLAALAASPSANAQPPGEVPSLLVCPAIEEDGNFCYDDPQSANCPGFVAAAKVLGGMYRSKVENHPGSEAGLLSAIWWGCGTATLSEIKSLLVRVGSPDAVALLDVEPYASVPPYSPSAESGPAPTRQDCNDLSTASARVSCASSELHAATAAHQRLFAACQKSVAPALRDQLAEAESSWKATRGLECGSDETSANEATFQRAECLTRATLERTRGLREAHPECAAAD